MTGNGIKTTDFESRSMVDALLGNATQDGIEDTVSIPVAVLANLLAESAGAIVAKEVKATFAQLDAIKGTMSDGDVGLVMFDPDEDLRGQYALVSGVLVRKADLTETQSEYWAGQAKLNADRVDLGDLDAAVLASTLLHAATEDLRDETLEARDIVLPVKDDVLAAKAATELARDASFALGPKYASESAGRDAVLDGATFLVQGSGEVAATEYRSARYDLRCR
jgi:hypothetical protein